MQGGYARGENLKIQEGLLLAKEDEARHEAWVLEPGSIGLAPEEDGELRTGGREGQIGTRFRVSSFNIDRLTIDLDGGVSRRVGQEEGVIGRLLLRFYGHPIAEGTGRDIGLGRDRRNHGNRYGRLIGLVRRKLPLGEKAGIALPTLGKDDRPMILVEADGADYLLELAGRRRKGQGRVLEPNSRL